MRSRARTDIWGTDIRPARSGAERARRPNKREQRQPAPAPAGGTLGAHATPAGVWLPPAAAGARQRAEHPPAERTPSFFVVLLPLPREGVGGGPIITERSEASARRRPQPPERSRVAICSQPSPLLRIDHPRRGLGSICKSPLLRTARRNLKGCARCRSDREAAPAGAAFRGSDAERKEVKQGNGGFNA